MGKDYNSAKSNTSPSVKSGGDGGKALEEYEASGGDGGGKALEEFKTDGTKGETSLGDIVITREAGEVSPDSVTMTAEVGDTTDAEGLGKSGGGGGKQPAREAGVERVSVDASADRGSVGIRMRDEVGKPGGEASPGGDYNSTRSNTTEIEVGGGGKQPAREAGGDHHSSRSNTTSVKSGGGGGSGMVTRTVGKTLGMAKTVIMAAVLISVAGAGVDVYQTYNDAIAIDLEKHITDADFELSEDKSEISGSVGFDIPEMGMFEKSIIASVHVTVLESNPITDGDYEFEYTLGSGEQFYDFTLDDLDPVTVETIEAGEPLDIEYSGTISVTYLGIEIPSVTMDIPLTTTTVETA